MIPLLVVLGVVVLVVLFAISVQRKLVTLDENCNNAMAQIGVQQSSRWDALTALLELAKGYAVHESETFAQVVAGRKQVTANTSTQDAQQQENLLSQGLGRLMAIAEAYPELKSDAAYTKTMDGVNLYENQVRTSRMVFNDSATKLNRAVRSFPDSIFAGIFGFRQRDYLAEETQKAQMPSMK